MKEWQGQGQKTGVPAVKLGYAASVSDNVQDRTKEDKSQIRGWAGGAGRGTTGRRGWAGTRMTGTASIVLLPRFMQWSLGYAGREEGEREEGESNQMRDGRGRRRGGGGRG